MTDSPYLQYLKYGLLVLSYPLLHCLLHKAKLYGKWLLLQEDKLYGKSLLSQEDKLYGKWLLLHEDKLYGKWWKSWAFLFKYVKLSQYNKLYYDYVKLIIDQCSDFGKKGKLTICNFTLQ